MRKKHQLKGKYQRPSISHHPEIVKEEVMSEKNGETWA
jgi:hypothetical protein